ncbi:hypothetical protein GEMRC1_001538 [Eukaryota sp. GEM-RC1]
MHQILPSMQQETMNPIKGVVPSRTPQVTQVQRCWIRVKSKINIVRFLLVIDILLMALIFANATFFDERLTENISIESSSNLAAVLWIQVVLSFLQAVVSVSCLIIFESAFSHRSASRLKKVLGLKFVFVVLDLFLFAYPTNFRLVAAFFGVIIHTATLCFLFYIYSNVVIRRNPLAPSNFNHNRPNTADRNQSPEVTAMVQKHDRLYQWMEIMDIRNRWKAVADKRSIYVLFVSLIFLLVFATFFAEFVKIFSFQGHFFTDTQLDQLNDYSELIENYWPANTTDQPIWRAHEDNKVLVFIVDGLRFDYFDHINDHMSKFFKSDLFKKDGKIFSAECNDPSFSVPNWMTLMTGSPPELTGVLGNLMIPDTGFDSVYRAATMSGTFNGLTASPWMRDIIDSQLETITGDGTVSTNYKTDLTSTAHLADQERARIMFWALDQKDDNEYKLWYTHLSNVDLQGHAFGVTEKFNKDNTYYESITNSSRIFEKLIDTVDENTVVLFVSDHGQIDVGGHGGWFEDNDVLSHVPLAFYKKGSSFGNSTVDWPKFSDIRKSDRYSLEDVAPSVAAILGLPIPRTSLGLVVDEVLEFITDEEHRHLVYQDLFEQKKKFVTIFAQTSGYSDKVNSNDYLSGKITLDSSSEPQAFIDGIDSMLKVYFEVREDYYSMQVSRNVLVSILLVIFLIVGLFFLAIKFTAMNFRALFAKKRHLLNYDQDYAKLNKKSCLTGFILIVLYFAISIPVFYVLTRLRSFEQWDASLVHTPEVIPTLLGTMFLPAVIMLIVISRLPSILVTRPNPDSTSFIGRIIHRIAWVTGFGDSHYVSDDGAQFVFLTQDYILFFTSIALLILMVLLGTFSFIVPFVFRIPFVDGNMWNFRFKILCILLQSLPLAITVLIQAKKINETHPGPAEEDHIYGCFMNKFKFIYSNDEKVVTSIASDCHLLSENNTSQFDNIESPVDLLVE